MCTPVCRARDEGERGGWELIASGRDDCFSRDYADAYRHARARAHVSANIDVNAICARIHRHADRARVFASDYLRASERTACNVWEGGEGDVSIFRQFIRLDRWTSATGGKSLRF